MINEQNKQEILIHDEQQILLHQLNPIKIIKYISKNIKLDFQT